MRSLSNWNKIVNKFFPRTSCFSLTILFQLIRLYNIVRMIMMYTELYRNYCLNFLLGEIVENLKKFVLVMSLRFLDPGMITSRVNWGNLRVIALPCTTTFILTQSRCPLGGTEENHNKFRMIGQGKGQDCDLLAKKYQNVFLAGSGLLGLFTFSVNKKSYLFFLIFVIPENLVVLHWMAAFNSQRPVTFIFWYC
jgi:hypothetical protein